MAKMSKNIIELGQNEEVAIFGAQMVAVSVYYAIKALYLNCKIVSFIVSDQEGNPDFIDGIPVVSLQEFDRKDIKILVATPENHHAAIAIALRERDIQNYFLIDSKVEATLMEQYYGMTSKFSLLHDWNMGKEKPDIAVFMSKFYKDQQLKNHYKMSKWIQPIQAGAALTDMRVAELCDDIGENISKKNVNYCELSALYWIGKHISAEYIGMFHYRRILDVTEDDLYRLKNNEIDVVLPYPTIHYPNIQEHHKRYLKDSDWDAMRQALEELAPDYAEVLQQVFGEQYFYNYNMLIAREAVFKDYCNWLFPILERIEELSSPKGNERADRYIGYLGDYLITMI